MEITTMRWLFQMNDWYCKCANCGQTISKDINIINDAEYQKKYHLYCAPDVGKSNICQRKGWQNLPIATLVYADGKRKLIFTQEEKLQGVN
jgi:hypothetical protein